MQVFSEPTLAGIIRISPKLVPAAKHREATRADRTLAELFTAWSAAEALPVPTPLRIEQRLAGTLAGPRQHKLRANLSQIRAELEHELACFLRKTERD
jgi:hypothetical protein